MDVKNFPPLVLLSKSQQPGREFSTRKKMFMSVRVKGADKLTVQSYIDLFLSPDFLNPLKKHPYSDLDRLFYNNIDMIMETTGTTREELLRDKAERFKTEVKDLYLSPVLIEEWSKSKQVYKPDPDFALALLKTQKLQLTRDMISHLPYNYFYIDLSDVEIFKPITGVFVFCNSINIDGIDIGSNISIYLLTEDLVLFSHYFTGVYDSKGIISIDISNEPDSDYNVWDPDGDFEYAPNSFNISRNQVSLFVLQLICYLTIEKPQITDSDYTKNTYVKRSPSQKVKNKWNEVHIYDVGITYGKGYRKQIKEYIKQNSALGKHSHHKSPIPHLRSAHWHRYWVGEGRTELKVKWIEPVFVGAKESKNVVIHKVEG